MKAKIVLPADADAPASAVDDAVATDVHRWRRSLFMLFFVIGVAMASWITRTPAIRDRLSASTAEMGLILFGLAMGSMTGLLSAGALVRYFDTRTVAFGGVFLALLGLLTMGLGTLLVNPWVVCGGLFLIGLGMGSSEIAVNIDGAAVERAVQAPVLAALHGYYSLGTFCGALLGIASTALAVPVHWHLVIGAVMMPALWMAARGLPGGLGTSAASDKQAAPSAPLWKERRLLMIGVIIMAMALAEGSANDWLPLLMVDGHGFAPTSGSFIFAGFALGMTVGRFAGNYFIGRFGTAAVVRASAVSCAIGLALAIFADHSALASLSVLFWGLGASLGFPVAISAAGASGPHPARRVELVAIAGYFAYLVGPPLLGFLGEHYGLRAALIVVLAMVVMAVFMAGATRTARGQALHH